MIIGCYTMDLYCENSKPFPDGIHPFNAFPVQITGNTREQCAKKARQLGWKLNFKNWIAICPICTRKGTSSRIV